MQFKKELQKHILDVTKFNYEDEIEEIIFNYDYLFRKLEDKKYLNYQDRDMLMNAIFIIRATNE